MLLRHLKRTVAGRAPALIFFASLTRSLATAGAGLAAPRVAGVVVFAGCAAPGSSKLPPSELPPAVVGTHFFCLVAAAFHFQPCFPSMTHLASALVAAASTQSAIRRDLIARAQPPL